MPDHTQPKDRNAGCGASRQNIGQVVIWSIILAISGVLLGAMAGVFVG